MDVERYLRKSGDKRIYSHLPFEVIGESWFNYQFSPDGDLVIVQAQGKHQEIAERAREIAPGVRIMFATERNGKAFAKLIGGKVIGYIVEVPQ